MPESVTKRAIELERKHPNKKMIIHYVQPHFPYIGEYAQQIRLNSKLQIGGFTLSFDEYDDRSDQINIENISLKEAISNPKYGLNVDDILKMYEETLEITLNSVEELIEDLDGKTTITADHGEMFGERPFRWARRHYSHPKRRRTDELCIVPWVEAEYKYRKKSIAEPPLPQKKVDESAIDNQLNALGYK
jgi:hypothetical protein